MLISENILFVIKTDQEIKHELRTSNILIREA